MPVVVRPVAAPGVRRRMRVSWIVWGILVAIGAIVVTIGAGVAILVDKTASAVDPEADARTPGTARLHAEKATYEVLLVRSRRDTTAASAGNVVCTVHLANERTITHRRQQSSGEHRGGQHIHDRLLRRRRRSDRRDVRCRWR